jgi:3-hydroxyacyl-[acyl-carrier-protein] dehydratase
MRLEYFQLVTRFTGLEADKRRIRAVCEVPLKSTVFEGHFPGYPLMPGVMLIECMAQTCGWLVSGVTGFVGLPVLAGVKEAKIRAAVFPGDTLEFEGWIVHEGSGYAIGEAKGFSKGQPICEAQLTYRIVPYPSPEFRKSLREWAAQVNFPLEEFAH